MYLGSDAIALAPFTDTISLSRRGRLGRADAQGRRDPRRRRQQGRARGAQVERLGVPGRQGQPSPFHGEGNPRAAGGRRPYAGALSRLGGRAGAAAGRAAVRFPLARARCRCRPAAPPIMRAWSRNTGSSASRACRSRSMSLPSSATARRRCRRADLAIFVSQSGETADTLASLALRQGAEAARALGGQRADLDHRARKRRGHADARRPGDRRRLDQGVHLPARGAGLPCDRGRPRARRAVGGRRERSWCAR